MFGKPKSIEEMIGMADSFIGMATGGKSSVESLTAEYMPKLVEMVKAQENVENGSSMMLTIMLDESKTFFVASVFELYQDGRAEPKAAYPINSLNELLDIFKNLKNDAHQTNTISAAPEQIAASEPGAQLKSESSNNGGNEHSGRIEGDGAGTGADSNGGNNGLPEDLDDGGAPPLS